MCWKHAWPQQQKQVLQWPHPATRDALSLAKCLPSEGTTVHYIEDIDTKCDRVMVVSQLSLQHSGIRKLHWHNGNIPLNIQN